MASEYNLKLRATLDTSQVQQELQKLKNSQNLAGNSPGGNGGGSAAGNVASLDVKKLNASIDRLGQVVARLAQAMRSPSAGGGSPRAAGLPGYGGQFGPDWDKWLRSDKYKELQNQFSAYRQQIGSAFGKEALKQFDKAFKRAGVNPNSQYSLHRLLSSGQLPASMDAANRQMLEAQRQAYTKHVNEWQNSIPTQEDAAVRNAKFMRGVGRAIGGHLMLDIGSTLEGVQGWEGPGRALRGMGTGLAGWGGTQMALTGAGFGAAAGPIGLGIGAVAWIATAQADMAKFTAELNKATEALKANYEALQKRTQGVQETLAGTRVGVHADALLAAGDRARAAEGRDYWQGIYGERRADLARMADPEEEKKKIIAFAEKQKAAVDSALDGSWLSALDSGVGDFLMGMFGQKTASMSKQEAKNQIDEYAQQRISAMLDVYDQKKRGVDTAKANADLYGNVVDRLDSKAQHEKQLSDREVAARLQLAERNDQSIAGYRAQGAANATQALADQTLNDKALSPLQKFGKIAEELDRARAAKNGALTGAFEIARYLKDNEGKLDSEEVRRKMKQQSDYERDAGFAQQRVGILENALSQIQHAGLAPDISHVTSLAQYGFNMGEKDDVAERMDKYYTRSLNLQEQIRNKLQEGVTTEATYTE